MKVRRVFQGLIILCMLVSMAASQDDTDSTALDKSALKKFQFDRVLEKGYRLNKLLHGREFARPVSFIPLELKYGAHFYFLPRIEGDTGTDDFTGGPFYRRLGHQIDLDVGKTNLSSLLFQSSWIDILTGMNIWYSSVLAPPDLPASWGGQRFAPRMIAPGLTNDLLLQWFDPWFIHLQYTYGLARMKMYRGESTYLDEPAGWGRSVAYTAGFRFIIDRGLDYRFAIGIDLNSRYTKFDNISDPDDLMPANKLYLNHTGFVLTISVFYGGQKTMGDAAKEKYYHRDYVTAKTEFSQFLDSYPGHANRRRAQAYIDDCNIKIPIQFMREGLSFDERRLEELALERYFMARRASIDPDLTAALNERIGQIAKSRLYRAENMLVQGQERAALALVTEVASFYVPAAGLIPRFKSRVEIREAENLITIGLYDKALTHLGMAVALDSTTSQEVYILRQSIVASLVKDANTIDEPGELNAAIQMLEEARSLSGSLGEKNDRLLQELKEKAESMEDGQLQQRIRKRMDAERQAMEEAKRPPLRTGMTVPEVQDFFGSPESILEKKGDKGENLQLWSYPLKNGRTLFLTFREFILIKFEEK